MGYPPLVLKSPPPPKICRLGLLWYAHSLGKKYTTLHFLHTVATCHSNISDANMPYWYRVLDCFALPTHWATSPDFIHCINPMHFYTKCNMPYTAIIFALQYMVAMVVMQHAIYRAPDCCDLPTHWVTRYQYSCVNRWPPSLTGNTIFQHPFMQESVFPL